MTRPPVSAIFVACCLLLGGCLDGRDAAGQADPTRTGDEQLPGSCEPADCGDVASSGSCYCDADCESFGDCCENRVSVCEAKEEEDEEEEESETETETETSSELHIRIADFIQCPVLSAPWNPYPYYHGDGRGFGHDSALGQSRVLLDIVVDPEGSNEFGEGLSLVSKSTGTTKAYWGSQVEDAPEGSACAYQLIDGAVAAAEEEPASEEIFIDSTTEERVDGSTIVTIRIEASAANPIAYLAPAADMDVEIVVEYQDGKPTAYWMEGAHDGFPAYEIYIDKEAVYTHDAIAKGQTVLSLFPPMEFSIDIPQTPIAP